MWIFSETFQSWHLGAFDLFVADKKGSRRDSGSWSQTVKSLTAEVKRERRGGGSNNELTADPLKQRISLVWED